MMTTPPQDWSGATFDHWLQGERKAKAETAAANSTDAFSADDSARTSCADEGLTRVTSNLVPGWNDMYKPKDFSDTHQMGPALSNVLYWPDDYDRKTIFMKNEFCNFTKWSICEYVAAGGDGTMEIDGQTLAERCGVVVADSAAEYPSDNEEEGNTGTAIAFLEVDTFKASQSIKRHHANMWTPQQIDEIGALVSASAEQDVKLFSDLLEEEILNKLKEKGLKKATASKQEEDAIKEEVLGKVLKKVAENECELLGGDKVEIRDRFEHLRVWFGPQVLKETAERCVLRPGQCTLVSYCKHLHLQSTCTPPADDATPSTCIGPCDDHSNYEACESSATSKCTWISTGEGDGRCL